MYRVTVVIRPRKYKSETIKFINDYNETTVYNAVFRITSTTSGLEFIIQSGCRESATYHLWTLSKIISFLRNNFNVQTTLSVVGTPMHENVTKLISFYIKNCPPYIQNMVKILPTSIIINRLAERPFASLLLKIIGYESNIGIFLRENEEITSTNYLQILSRILTKSEMIYLLMTLDAVYSMSYSKFVINNLYNTGPISFVITLESSELLPELVNSAKIKYKKLIEYDDLLLKENEGEFK